MARKSRIEIYPDTKTFHYHNQNPKNRITGDCTFRAISLATNIPYNEVVMEMAKVQCETGYALNDKKGIERYLQKIGWQKMSSPKKYDNSKYTGKEFCEEIQSGKRCNFGNIVANIGGHHIICIKDGKINDIWDCSNKCIGNYWVKIKN